MILTSLANVTVTARRFGQTVHGDRIDDEPEREIGSYAFNPRESTERTDLQEITITEAVLYGGPRDHGLKSTDVVLISGEVDSDGMPSEWRIESDIKNWTSAITGDWIGAEFAVRRVTTH